MLKDILAAPGPGRQRLQRFPDGEVARPPLRLQVLTEKRPRYLKKPAVNFAGFNFDIDQEARGSYNKNMSKAINHSLDPKKCVVFFDFDNTIATCDVFDNMLLLFSKDDRWVELEKRWKSGKIGSKTCLEGQLRGMDMTQKTLDAYLPKIKLDPYYKPIYKFLIARKVKTITLSDNFDYILQKVLAHNGIRKLKVYANKLKFIRGKMITDFPFKNKDCQVCAHCKTKNLLANTKTDSIIIYIGDGASDVCPAKYAHLVFAKDSLLRHFKDNKLECIPYRNLKDVHTYLQRNLK